MICLLLSLQGLLLFYILSLITSTLFYMTAFLLYFIFYFRNLKRTKRYKVISWFQFLITFDFNLISNRRSWLYCPMSMVDAVQLWRKNYSKKNRDKSRKNLFWYFGRRNMVTLYEFFFRYIFLYFSELWDPSKCLNFWNNFSGLDCKDWIDRNLYSLHLSCDHSDQHNQGISRYSPGI